MMKISWKWSGRGVLFEGRPHEEIAEICASAGFSGLECNRLMFESASTRELENVRRIYESQDIIIPTFHLPDSLNDDIASFYEDERIAAVKTVMLWMGKARLLGASVGILHPTTSRFNVRSNEELLCYLDRLGRSLEELLPVAEDLSFSLALENMLPSFSAMSRFGALASHIELIKNKFKHPNLGFCYDTGHALIAEKGRALDILNAMEPFPIAYHLQDNAGDRDNHLAPGHGLVNWAGVFRMMKEIEFSGYATIEAPPFADGPIYSMRSWEKLLESTIQLAEKALEGCHRSSLSCARQIP